ncbi:LysR family transcriptional regulator [Antarcticibacterium flavum]|uniref:LysR family transcriptional regulator n=1 Tax=Antarcticibacterium flavum TaxID=2058175 RepID=A0A5B7X281_9FLAO|nr:MULTISPECIES: LysR family transcriptional regulator [Antarcticibacterium]MCM4159816.1 LysR family transcriptional regulator [Antarcticibacterium sp. W02-3]QCY68822.1 LysR family transcriptional regulator [Antarcticibacterium flavum]
MNYTLHQLQVFHTVSRLGSITKAAEELHLSQPAISIQVRNLQEQFEIPLIENIGRKIFITEFGQEIAEAAGRILQEVNAINSKAAAYKGELIGTLRITSVSTGKYVIPTFLTNFIKQHQGIELVLDVTNRSRVRESLEKNEVDFALVSVMPENLQVDEIELMENKLYLVGSSREEQDLSNFGKKILQNIPLIFRETGSGTRHIMEKYIKQKKIPVTKKMELTSNEAVKQAIIANLGYSIMPIIGIRNELKTGILKIIPVDGFPIQSRWKLVWLKGKNLSPVALSFVNYLSKNKEQIIRENFEELN